MEKQDCLKLLLPEVTSFNVWQGRVIALQT